MTGIAILGMWYLVVYFPRRLVEERMRATTAESERRNAELARLRSNLHPHFLLNSLNAVSGLLATKPRQARHLVGLLGDLLRDSLAEDSDMRSLAEEVIWLRRYAEVFEIRYRGQISFEWDLAAETLNLPIPRLLLQPLVENAIKHGALRQPDGGTVRVRSRRIDGKVRITVEDDGSGLGETARERPGLGLRLVRDRLGIAFPDADMAINSSDAGTIVMIGIRQTGPQ